MAARRWLIAGRVQGVGFRWSTYREANGTGLAGWVRNLPDGRVEVVAKGAELALQQLDAFLRTGPPGARVENVEKASIPHEQVMYNSFTIM